MGLSAVVAFDRHQCNRTRWTGETDFDHVVDTVGAVIAGEAQCVCRQTRGVDSVIGNDFAAGVTRMLEGAVTQFDRILARCDNRKAVVLMDEIDKAPRDLPNDILAAIENLSFEVSETGSRYTVVPENLPIIVMTSNSEKNLPDAFLRRVIYYHIPFPDAAALLRIVSAKVDGYNENSLKKLIAHFEEIRSGKTVKLSKNPATSELINWVSLLKKMDFNADKIDGELSASERTDLFTSYSVLAKNRNDLKEIQKMLA